MYQFKNLQVKLANKLYNDLPHTYEVNFYKNSNVEFLDEPDMKILKIHYQFKTVQDIIQLEEGETIGN